MKPFNQTIPLCLPDGNVENNYLYSGEYAILKLLPACFRCCGKGAEWDLRWVVSLSKLPPVPLRLKPQGAALDRGAN